MTKPLAGKAALVTGGSRGIGAAIVKRLAREGADVVFSYSASKSSADEVSRKSSQPADVRPPFRPTRRIPSRSRTWSARRMLPTVAWTSS